MGRMVHGGTSLCVRMAVKDTRGGTTPEKGKSHPPRPYQPQGHTEPSVAV